MGGTSTSRSFAGGPLAYGPLKWVTVPVVPKSVTGRRRGPIATIAGSPRETMPTSRPSSTTGTWRTECFAITWPASSSSASGASVYSCVVIRSRTGVVSGFWPSTTSWTMSRSVMIPTGASPSMTTTADAWCVWSWRAASATVSSGVTVTKCRDITSAIAIASPRPRGAACRKERGDEVLPQQPPLIGGPAPTGHGRQRHDDPYEPFGGVPDVNVVAYRALTLG